MPQKYFSKFLGITTGILIPICVIGIVGYSFIQKSKQEKPWKPEKEIYSLNEIINYGPITYTDIVFKSPLSPLSKEEFKKMTEAIDEVKTKMIDDAANLGISESLNTRIKEKNKVEKLKMELSAIKITIKNSYDNKNEIVTNNSQYIIRDGDKIIKPYSMKLHSRELDERNWGINKTLKSGEETTGYLFFKETNFSQPILEINSITGSYPIKIRLY